jgi:hypothetical protein
MDELNCSAKLDSEENTITVNGLTDELSLDISGDVDFTALIQELTKKIDEEKTIVLTVEDEESITDSKHKLIIGTLKKFFDSYNESLKDIEVVSDDNNEDKIPF